MALGLLMCGRDALPFKKVEVDLAFGGAWRRWAYRDRFPRVSTDLEKGLDAYLAMTRADERKNVWNLYWETPGRELVICARPNGLMNRSTRTWWRTASMATCRRKVGATSRRSFFNASKDELPACGPVCH
jgi:hypothetical protein